MDEKGSKKGHWTVNRRAVQLGAYVQALPGRERDSKEGASLL